jgi:hypothetical protein
MQKLFLLLLIFTSFCACKNNAPTPDAWSNFKKCASNNCIQEVLAVKDAFLKNPQQVLTEFQATYEIGEDHVIGWLYVLRDSVLINPKMGTVEARLAMQQAIMAAAKPFEKDAKVHEMAKSVLDELGIVDVKAGKINDPMAAESDVATTDYCYHFSKNGENMSIQVNAKKNGDFRGYYNWYIEEKDGTNGVLHGRNFQKDTIYMTYEYYQEGIFSNEQLAFVKKGDNLLRLVSKEFDKKGNMVLTNKKTLKAENTLTKVDCAKITKDFDNTRKIEAELGFKYPYPETMSEKDEKVEANLQGVWQSLDDPKASIKMKDGKFQYLYSGKATEPEMRYRYFLICPKNCNPVAKMPCLLVFGQDEVCYSLVKADGKALEISQIGGTGNTNRYVKKK